MDQKEKEAPKPQDKPREPLLSRNAYIIIGAVVAIQIVVLATVLIMRMPAKVEKPVETATAEKEKDTTVELGKVEVSKANDPMQESFTRVTASVFLVVPAEKAALIKERIAAIGPILRESARQAFLDADSRDLATENVAGVKNSMKTRINQELGEDVVKQIVFPEYKAY